MAVLPIDIYGFDEGLVSFRTLCGVQSSLVRFAPNQAQHSGRHSVDGMVDVIANDFYLCSGRKVLRTKRLKCRKAPELAKLQAESYVGVR